MPQRIADRAARQGRCRDRNREKTLIEGVPGWLSQSSTQGYVSRGAVSAVFAAARRVSLKLLGFMWGWFVFEPIWGRHKHRAEKEESQAAMQAL